MQFRLPNERDFLEPRPKNLPPDTLLTFMADALAVTTEILGNCHTLEVLGCRKTPRLALARAVWVSVVRRHVFTHHGQAAIVFGDPPESWIPISYPMLGALTGRNHSTFVLAVKQLARKGLRHWVDQVSACLEQRHIGQSHAAETQLRWLHADQANQREAYGKPDFEEQAAVGQKMIAASQP